MYLFTDWLSNGLQVSFRTKFCKLTHSQFTKAGLPKYRFCATGTMGIIGNLTSGEILEQLVHANTVTKIRNVVFMGMGEPL